EIIETIDDSIKRATGTSTRETSEEDIIKWLFSSPFDRSEGLRQKTIAVKGSEQLLKETEKLSKQGYHIVRLDEVNTEDVIDVVVTDENQIAKEIEAVTDQGLKIIWFTETNVSEKADTSIYVINGKNILEEAQRIRATAL